MKTILTIAGSDCSGGAGIQQDLRTITYLRQYAATAITALTSQNTLGVKAVNPVSADIVSQQIDAIVTDLNIDAVKIGMIPNLACAKVIAKTVSTLSCPIVYDPVMVSTSGTRLMDEDCIEYLASHLFPLCSLVTPNIPEHSILSPYLQSTPYLRKGGHAETEDMTDILYMPDGSIHSYSAPKIESSNLHGTGCCLSSAIATYLALGLDLPQAVGKAKETVTHAIELASHHNIGHGNGPILPL